MAIETAQEIYDEIINIVKDPSYDLTAVLPILNKGLKKIAGKVLLPELETQDDIPVGTAKIIAKTISFDNATSTIADSDKGLAAAGFRQGYTITITGASEPGNNQTTTIESIESDGSSMVVTGTLTDETAGSEITIISPSISYVPLPSNYHKNLFRCYSLTNNWQIDIYESVALLLRDFSRIDRSGIVVGVAVRGSNLHYQRIPSSPETLRIHYYKIPTVLADENSQPDCLPQHLVRPLLVNYGCEKLFGKIEQDMVEEHKYNTLYHRGLFKEAMDELEAFIGPESKEPIDIKDELDLEAYL